MNEQEEITIIIEGLDEFENTQIGWFKKHLSNPSIDNRTLRMDLNLLINIKNIKEKYNKRFNALKKHSNK